MNWLKIIFYPIIALFSFFGGLIHKYWSEDRVEPISIWKPFHIKGHVHLSPPLVVTPYIQRGEVSEARKKSKVTPDFGGIQTYSGFFNVDMYCGNNLFFWFIPSEGNWENAPLVLWLNGGPGASSLFGLFHEVGPWKYENGDLVKNKYSWNKFANLLFVDQPVGTGFSFSDRECFATKSEDVTEALYSVVIQFLKMFPQLQKNKFFLVGMSFAGHYVPETAAYIDEKNQRAEIKVNLAGVVVGSPSIKQICNYKGDLLFELGVADENDRDTLNNLHAELVKYVEAGELERAVELDAQIHGKLEEIGLPNYYNILSDKEQPTTYEFSTLVTTAEMKERIHVGDSTHVYRVINTDVTFNYRHAYYGDNSASAIKYLAEKNYIVGFFFGQLDTICSYTNFNCPFKGMEWEGFNRYLQATKQPLHVSGELAGHFKIYKNLFTVVLQNSGHNIPEDQPEVMFTLMNVVLHSTPKTLEEDLKSIH